MNNQQRIDQTKPQAPEAWRDGESRVYKSVDCGRGKCDRMVGNVFMENDMGKCWRGICPVCEGDLYMSNQIAESTSYTEAPKESTTEALPDSKEESTPITQESLDALVASGEMMWSANVYWFGGVNDGDLDEGHPPSVSISIDPRGEPPLILLSVTGRAAARLPIRTIEGLRMLYSALSGGRVTEAAPAAEASGFDPYGIKVKIKDFSVFANLTLESFISYIVGKGWTREPDKKEGLTKCTYRLNRDRLWLPVKVFNDHEMSMRIAFRALADFEGKNELLLLSQIKGATVETVTEAPITPDNGWIAAEGDIPRNELFELCKRGSGFRYFARYLVDSNGEKRWHGYDREGDFTIQNVSHYARPRLGPHDSPPATEATEAKKPVTPEAESTHLFRFIKCRACNRCVNVEGTKEGDNYNGKCSWCSARMKLMPPILSRMNLGKLVNCLGLGGWVARGDAQYNNIEVLWDMIKAELAIGTIPEATEAPQPSEAESEASDYEAFGPMRCSEYLPIDGQEVQFLDEECEIWRQGWYGGLMFISVDKKGEIELYPADMVKRWQAPNGPHVDEIASEAKQVSNV